MASPPQRPGRRGAGGPAGSDDSGGAVVPLRGRRDDPAERSALSRARRYTPRGRTVRDEPPQRSTRTSDPFRPALAVVSGDLAGRRAGASRDGRDGDVDDDWDGDADDGWDGEHGGTRARPAPAGRPASPRQAARGRETGRREAERRASGRRGATAGPAARSGRGGTTRPKRPLRHPGRSGLADRGRRLRLSTVLVVALFATIGIRLVALQVTDAKVYAAQGLRSRLTTVVIPAHRGSILDRTGAVLAESVQASYVYADPGMITDPTAVADKLFPLLGTVGISRSDLIAKMSQKKRADGSDDRFEYLARGIDVSLGNAIAALNITGIGVRPDERRDVPGHDLAANLIGVTGLDSKGSLTGLLGLEAKYNALLRGSDGSRTFESGLDSEIPSGYHEQTPARPGTSLELTIDRNLQFRVQQILAEVIGPERAKFAAAVVLDSQTGDVLAQASYPTFDAADPASVNPTTWTDAASGMVVDPGSVAKVIALGAALQDGVINANSTVTIGPTIRKGDVTYSDTTPFPSGTKITLPGILAYSSNVGTITIASKLGAAQLYQYQLKYGLGQPTGEGLPDEASGLVQPPANWSPSSYGSIPIGMGISVTPLQMAAVYATIANNGVYVRPRLVRATIPPSGKVVMAPPSPRHEVLSPANAAILRQALVAVTTVRGATGLSARIPGYEVAGKTGTGGLVVNGHYAPGEVASFVGMAPASSPRYVVAVFAYTPHGEGGPVCGPAFSKIMSFVLRAYDVPPTGTKPPVFRITG